MEFEQYREDYNGNELDRSDLLSDPVDQFQKWFDEATTAGVTLPDAMTLATADADGMPSARTVVLRGYGPEGFRFFTNLESRKAQDLQENTRAALTFYWKEFHRQVRLSGPVSSLPREDVEAYFRKRPRESRIAAHVSDQSSVITDRAELEELREQFLERFRNKQIPCPENWGGYRLTPKEYIFWQGRAGRLHDRFRYRKDDGTWTIQRLAP